MVHPTFQTVVKELVRRLDEILANSHQEVERMDKYRAEIEIVLDCVRAYDKKRKGTRQQNETDWKKYLLQKPALSMQITSKA